MIDCAVENIQYKGRSVTELDRDELLACIKWLMEDSLRRQSWAKQEREMRNMFDRAAKK